MDKDIDLSVVLSVYNGERYIKDAVDSILSQTYKNYELIIINDGSTDNTEKILKSYSDKRIRIISRPNKGLVASLNEGILAARGKYIARHDADDRSLPNRFQVQMDFLTKNPAVVLLGSSMQVIDEDGKILHSHHVLINDPELRQELLVRSPFAHGSVIFLKEAAVAAGLYRQEYWPAEDYDLWLRISKYGKLANINEPLYIYRESTGGISAQNAELQIQKTDAVRKLAWERKRELLRGLIIFSNYKGLTDGEHRIERIINNVTTIYKYARKQRANAFALKLLAILAGNVQTYRRAAGRIKRRIG